MNSAIECRPFMVSITFHRVIAAVIILIDAAHLDLQCSARRCKDRLKINYKFRAFSFEN